MRYVIIHVATCTLMPIAGGDPIELLFSDSVRRVCFNVNFTCNDIEENGKLDVVLSGVNVISSVGGRTPVLSPNVTQVTITDAFQSSKLSLRVCSNLWMHDIVRN